MNRKRALMRRKISRSFKHTKKILEYLSFIEQQYGKDTREFHITDVVSECQIMVYRMEDKLKEIKKLI